MKKIIFLIVVSTLLVACGNKEKANNVPDNAAVEQNSINTTAPADAPFNFTHFELEIEYDKDISYDVSYEKEKNGIEVKIEDELNKKMIQGNEAMDTLLPIFKSFTFDATTDSDVVIDEVLQKFGQPNNFKTVEIEITFADGTKKEYRRTQ
ncbi:YusW family protein [Solibacillus daqui]|uniref:YusW family protein n=1 Tax=Solibacillus daqui TaxID=2912187 RepID=UPI0023650BDC|nr:YusW family protein [Solibacillus daqui]